MSGRSARCRPIGTCCPEGAAPCRTTNSRQAGRLVAAVPQDAPQVMRWTNGEQRLGRLTWGDSSPYLCEPRSAGSDPKYRVDVEVKARQLSSERKDRQSAWSRMLE